MSDTNDAILGPAQRATRDLILSVAEALVLKREFVSIQVKEDSTSTTFILTVASEDLDRILGKEGRTAQSIRAVLAAASVKQRRQYALDIRCVESSS